ncbi:uncharacterized protein LOC143549360 [Bidens hawaiensis]|uniref:uncharacterized protein LOC143549360 n=1 Tax=Bidens hawaiensis TaxID=980011 RepID=UPI0040495E22
MTYGSLASGSFDITVYTGPHTCLHSKITQDHPNLDASLIAQEVQHPIKEQPSITITALKAEIVNKLGYTPSYKKVWLGKQKAIENAFGDWEESYNILPKFMETLKKFNPGTIVEWCILRQIGVEHMEFRCVFWAFDPSINGFKHCRPVISIDATHLYGKYKGKMMIAMGVDGNNQIFPLAFAIVENESYASWSWFLSYVKKHVVKDIEGICLISDRHAGILKAVKESPWLEPHGFHIYCLRRFINNFNDKFRNSQLKVLAYRVVSQNQIRKFNSIMEEIGKINSNARQWLEAHAPERWTLAHDGGNRSGLLSTNLSKIFKSWEIFKYPCSHILSACAKPSLNSWQYVDKCYSIVDYRATWLAEFSPLPHEAYWPDSLSIRELLPNSELRRDKKGRPRLTRLRNGMDIKETEKANRCGICKQLCHNRATSHKNGCLSGSSHFNI